VGIISNGSLEQFEADFQRRDLALGFVGRLGREHPQHRIQGKLAAGFFRQDQMPHMRGVKCAAKNTQAQTRLGEV
jgi:hypothetical protein